MKIQFYHRKTFHFKLKNIFYPILIMYHIMTNQKNKENQLYTSWKNGKLPAIELLYFSIINSIGKIHWHHEMSNRFVRKFMNHEIFGGVEKVKISFMRTIKFNDSCTYRKLCLNSFLAMIRLERNLWSLIFAIFWPTPIISKNVISFAK